MRATKAKSEIRQRQIAQAALKLLALRGWRRVSLTDIAKAVGIVTSDIYRHFKGKDEVLDAVLELVDQNFQTNLQAARLENANPLACLYDVLMRHVELISSGIPIPRIVLSEDVFSGRTRHRKRVHEIYQKYLAGISTFIEEGQKANAIRSELAPDTLSLMWLGLVQSPAILWLVSQGSFDLRQHCERAWRLYLEMIRPTPSENHHGI